MVTYTYDQQGKIVAFTEADGCKFTLVYEQTRSFIHLDRVSIMSYRDANGIRRSWFHRHKKPGSAPPDHA